MKKKIFDVIDKCPVFPLSKGHRLPFNLTRQSSTDFLQKVHLDLRSIYRTISINHEQYYVLFTDYFSGYKVFYGAHSKKSE